MDARRSIPSVDRLLTHDAFAALLLRWPRDLVVMTLQERLQALRPHVLAGDADVPDAPRLAVDVAASMEALAGGSLTPVINATGVILHTNLGRAPLAAAALDAMIAVGRGYSNLEYDLESGVRGSRYAHCRALLCRLTGAEDALVVNNNAAAVVLALNTFAAGREAVVSRGELVEIGGAFRIPEIMTRSGAVLREVGSTNRTHASDYGAAMGADTGAVLKVHPSNFTMSGYTAEVGIGELAEIAVRSGVPLIHDVGSGLLISPAELGLSPGEPTPRESLRDGASIVTMSGDKLLGGPQCGIVLGRAELIERMRTNPLCRALRVDKLTLAALAATLRLYLDPVQAMREIPVLRMLTLTPAEIATRAAAFARECTGLGVDARVEAGTSAVGGGAAAAVELPTMLVVIARRGMNAEHLERRLRAGTPAVIARVIDDHVAIDMRTIAAGEEPQLIQALRGALS